MFGEVGLDVLSLRRPWDVYIDVGNRQFAQSLKLGGEVGAIAKDLGVAA